MASMLFKRDTFFKGSDNFDQLVKIVKVLGEEDLYTYCKRYALKIPSEVKSSLSLRSYPKVPWENFITKENQQYCSEDALDLLTKML